MEKLNSLVSYLETNSPKFKIWVDSLRQFSKSKKGFAFKNVTKRNSYLQLCASLYLRHTIELCLRAEINTEVDVILILLICQEEKIANDFGIPRDSFNLVSQELKKIAAFDLLKRVQQELEKKVASQRIEEIGYDMAFLRSYFAETDTLVLAKTFDISALVPRLVETLGC